MVANCQVGHFEITDWIYRKVTNKSSQYTNEGNDHSFSSSSFFVVIYFLVHRTQVTCILAFVFIASFVFKNPVTLQFIDGKGGQCPVILKKFATTT